MSKVLIFFIAGLLFIQFKKKEEFATVKAIPFDSIPVAAVITPGLMDEASGIADSKTFPGHLWVQQDGGNSAAIKLLAHNGNLEKSIHLKSAYNRDWEDMATGAGPVQGVNYLYIAETGDNSTSQSYYIIYRFEEPSSSTDTIRNYDKINFKYPDGSHDAEAIFIDNSTKDIYIITKRDVPSKVYKLPYPQNTSFVITATAVGSFGFSGVTSAAISPDSKELLVKTYGHIYYFNKLGKETIESLLQKKPKMIGYVHEPQGEAICFKNDNTGFFTLSEKPSFIPAVSLNFYKRK
jgi:hypothetical protein